MAIEELGEQISEETEELAKREDEGLSRPSIEDDELVQSALLLTRHVHATEEETGHPFPYGPSFWRDWSQKVGKLKKSASAKVKEQERELERRKAKMRGAARKRRKKYLIGGSAVFADLPNQHALLDQYRQTTQVKITSRRRPPWSTFNAQAKGASFTSRATPAAPKEGSLTGPACVAQDYKCVLPSAPAYSFSTVMHSDNVRGPHPKYCYPEPLKSQSGTVMAKGDRFKASIFSSVMPGPGPGSYDIKDSCALGQGRAPLFSSKKFSETKWSQTLPPEHLKEWTGFGYGCDLEEHILYDQCLSGGCSKRHMLEKRNDLLIRQFNGHDAVSTSSSRSLAHKKSTALHYACLYGELKILDKLLRDNAADIDAVDERGRTVLHVACEGKRHAIAQRLLLNGEHIYQVITKDGFVSHRRASNVNIQDNKGNTALHLACRVGCPKIVGLLLEAGADTSIANKRNEIAQDLVDHKTGHKIYQLLQYKSNTRLVQLNIEHVRQRAKALERQRKDMMFKADIAVHENLQSAVRRLERRSSRLDEDIKGYRASTHASLGISRSMKRSVMPSRVA
ncbi:unnamed protein product [Chrysoparadoxa australica]